MIINLKSKNHNFLPKTRTSKNGLREGDPHLEKLYQWILGKVIEPPKDSQLAQHEKELFDILHDNIKQYIGDENAVVEREHHTFATAGNDVDKIRIDLFQNANGKITIYEGKKDKTTIKDVYQLRMYWDGLVFDELDPYQGLLVAVEHPQTVQDMVKIVNTMKDAKGRQYNLKCTTWMELGIQHSGKKQ